MPTTKIAKPYPYLYRDIDRQGEIRWRLRAPGRKTTTIKGTFGSPEFAANYRATMEGIPAEKVGLPTKHGTMAALARRYLHSADFAALAPTTQRARRHLVEQFIEQYGNQHVAGLERRHVKAIMDSNAGKPGKARNVLTMLRLLIAIAMDDGTIPLILRSASRSRNSARTAGMHGQRMRSPNTSRSIRSPRPPASPSPWRLTRHRDPQT